MSIDEEVKKVIAKESERESSADFKNLRDFYEVKKREGIALKPKYALPPLDTVGRTLPILSRKANKE